MSSAITIPRLKQEIRTRIEVLRKLLKHELKTPEIISYIKKNLNELINLIDVLLQVATGRSNIKFLNVKKLMEIIGEDISRLSQIYGELIEAKEELDTVRLREILKKLDVQVNKLVTKLTTIFIAKQEIDLQEIELLFSSEIPGVPVTDLAMPELSENAKRLLTLLLQYHELSKSRIVQLFGKDADNVIKELEKHGYVIRLYDPLIHEEKVRLLTTGE